MVGHHSCYYSYYCPSWLVKHASASRNITSFLLTASPEASFRFPPLLQPLSFPWNSSLWRRSVPKIQSFRPIRMSYRVQEENCTLSCHFPLQGPRFEEIEQSWIIDNILLLWLPIQFSYGLFLSIFLPAMFETKGLFSPISGSHFWFWKQEP